MWLAHSWSLNRLNTMNRPFVTTQYLHFYVSKLINLMAVSWRDDRVKSASYHVALLRLGGAIHSDAIGWRCQLRCVWLDKAPSVNETSQERNKEARNTLFEGIHSQILHSKWHYPLTDETQWSSVTNELNLKAQMYKWNGQTLWLTATVGQYSIYSRGESMLGGRD